MGSNFSKEGYCHIPTLDRRNLDIMRDYLRNYNPPEGCGDCINILFFGLVGDGKSSTINTFLSALDRRGETISCVPTGDHPKSHTPELKYYREGKLKFWDTAGWNVICVDQAKTVDWNKNKRVFQMILEGRIPNGTNLKSFDPDSDVSNNPVIPENVIHGVAFVCDIHTIDNISDIKMKELQELQRIVARKYIYGVVIMTKFDLLDIREKDIAWIYEYKPLQQKFEYLAERTGLDRRSIFVVSNWWSGRHIEMIRCILALYVLENMVRNIDRSLRAVQ